jgi:hypothetical protein
MIDTNVRSVKRTDSGATILTKATEKLSSLCNHCGIQRACDHYARIHAIQRVAKITAPVTRCALYQYPIHFTSALGLDTPGFNTTRLGEAWSKRIRVGDSIALLNHDKQLIDSARVSQVAVTPLTVEGLLLYAKFNHMLINQAMSDEDAAARLLKILRNNYGKLVFERSATVTVIVF